MQRCHPRCFCILIAFLLLAVPGQARSRFQGNCPQWNRTVTTTTAEIVSTTTVLRSFPFCVVTIYAPPGTTNIAAIDSDDSGTIMANPFIADAQGHWFFYAGHSRYDVALSGAGISPVWIRNCGGNRNRNRPSLHSGRHRTLVFLCR